MTNKSPKKWVKVRKCKGCSADISHKHINAKFHSSSCKDAFHNRHNPRGYGNKENECYDYFDEVDQYGFDN